MHQAEEKGVECSIPRFNSLAFKCPERWNEEAGHRRAQRKESNITESLLAKHKGCDMHWVISLPPKCSENCVIIHIFTHEASNVQRGYAVCPGSHSSEETRRC